VIAVVPHVPVLPSRIGHTERGYAKVLRRHFEHVLDDARAAVGSGVDAGFLLEEGSPSKVIAAVTRLLDLVVIGSRGYGPVRRALLGGTAADVVATARCPTLVVPRGG
jgi:nucleotide-binding universal stress UspA family protein